MQWLLCNKLIQPHFDNGSQAPKKCQCAHNKCEWFCLNLNNRAHFEKKEFNDKMWVEQTYLYVLVYEHFLSRSSLFYNKK